MSIKPADLPARNNRSHRIKVQEMHVTSNNPAHTPGPNYTDNAVRLFALAAVVWGVVGMLVGVVIAAQLAWPELNLASVVSYGRLRRCYPAVTSPGGSALFANRTTCPAQRPTRSSRPPAMFTSGAGRR